MRKCDIWTAQLDNYYIFGLNLMFKPFEKFHSSSLFVRSITLITITLDLDEKAPDLHDEKQTILYFSLWNYCVST